MENIKKAVVLYEIKAGDEMLIEKSHIKQKMNLGQRFNLIKAAFGGLSPDQITTSMASRFMPLYGEPPRRSTKDWIDLYNQSPRMNPVHQIASDVGCALYGIYNQNDTKKIKLRQNPVELLLKNPSADLTMTEYVLFAVVTQ